MLKRSLVLLFALTLSAVVLMACAGAGKTADEPEGDQTSSEQAGTLGDLPEDSEGDYYANSDAPFDLTGGKRARETLGELSNFSKGILLAYGFEGDPASRGTVEVRGIVCAGKVSFPDPLNFVTEDMLKVVDQDSGEETFLDLEKLMVRARLFPGGEPLDFSRAERNENYGIVALPLPEGVSEGLAEKTCAIARGDPAKLEGPTNFVYIHSNFVFTDGRVIGVNDEDSSLFVLHPKEKLSAEGGQMVVAIERSTGMPQVVGMTAFELTEAVSEGFYLGVGIDEVLFHLNKEE